MREANNHLEVIDRKQGKARKVVNVVCFVRLLKSYECCL